MTKSPSIRMDPLALMITFAGIKSMLARGTLIDSLMLKFFLAIAPVVLAQGNYEVQVYPSETVKPGATMVELHSNFTVQGTKGVVDGVLPTTHQWHETIEITHGFNEWFETGFYVFTSAAPGQGYQYVGDHIRPRVRVPEEWK